MNNGQGCNYLDSVKYDKFGAVTSRKYGNGLKMQYAYHPQNRRLTGITTLSGNSQLSNTAYSYDPAGNITQAVSSYPWLAGQTFTETFSYDSTNQLVSAANTQTYALSVTYGDWGKIQEYGLSQTDLGNNVTTSQTRYYSYGSLNEGQTTFAPNNISYADGTDVNEQYGIGGSLQRRETTYPDAQPSEELYRFGADGNLRMYSYDRLFFALYGYDGGTTRTYKYSMDLSPNWVNGRLESVNFNLHTAMFYPNSYLNFNQDGYYTKHYYNGMERIASRLGDQNLPISTHDPELQDRKDWQDSLIRKNVTEITGYEFLPVGEEQDPDDPKPIYELPQVSITNLVPNTPSIYYYHPNHLGSTAFITDQNQTIVQGFLYAPFGEITNEHSPMWQNGNIPKYAFNAKELDEETGMYYYEARYYAPPVFISRDRLFEKYPFMSPYGYCMNNPIKYIDPSGDSVNIMGDAADLATSQLSSRGMKIFRDNKTGFIGYTLTGKKLTNSDRQMIDAIDSKKVNVNIYATTASKFNFEDITLSNNSFGQFLGVTVSDCLSKNNSDRTAETYQLVNPYLGEIADNKYDVNLGTSLRHEITESYQAGLICIDEGISCGPCWRTWENHVIRLYDHVYYRAHKRATPQPDMLAEKRREAYNSFIKKLNLPMHLINRL